MGLMMLRARRRCQLLWGSSRMPGSEYGPPRSSTLHPGSGGQWGPRYCGLQARALRAGARVGDDDPEHSTIRVVPHLVDVPIDVEGHVACLDLRAGDGHRLGTRGAHHDPVLGPRTRDQHRHGGTLGQLRQEPVLVRHPVL